MLPVQDARAARHRSGTEQLFLPEVSESSAGMEKEPTESTHPERCCVKKISKTANLF
jgi:hypothetical protein